VTGTLPGTHMDGHRPPRCASNPLDGATPARVYCPTLRKGVPGVNPRPRSRRMEHLL
jgi:hypothetical protein